MRGRGLCSEELRGEWWVNISDGAAFVGTIGGDAWDGARRPCGWSERHGCQTCRTAWTRALGLVLSGRSGVCRSLPSWRSGGWDTVPYLRQEKGRVQQLLHGMALSVPEFFPDTPAVLSTKVFFSRVFLASAAAEKDIDICAYRSLARSSFR